MSDKQGFFVCNNAAFKMQIVVIKLMCCEAASVRHELPTNTHKSVSSCEVTNTPVLSVVYFKYETKTVL